MQKTGRNDLCPCGSGNKYKRCCASKVAAKTLSQVYVNLPAMALIVGLGILVYSNTFDAPFHLDDAPSIVGNPFIKHLNDLQAIWNYVPRRFFLYLSLALNYHFNGLDVSGYHLFNLLVHLACGLLVWRLALLTLSTPVLKDDGIARHAGAVALLAGLVFVSHPVQIEAVTYIVQRAASLATFFYLAALCLYVQSRLMQEQQPSSAKFYYAGSLLLAVMAMFTKEITITLPLMIMLYEFSFFRTGNRFHWKYPAPFLLTLGLIPLTMLLIRAAGEDTAPAGISSWHYLLTQFRVLVTYIRLVFLPLNQNLDYDYHISRSIFELPVALSFLFLAGVLGWAAYLFSKYRLVAFSIFWFFLSLLPESSIVPIRDIIFEHRLYLPLVGYSLFLVSGIYYLWGRRNFKIMVIVLALIIGFNSVLAYQRNEIWRDDLTLWNDTISKSPYKARPYNNRGQVYYKQGKVMQVLTDFNKAIALDPREADAYYNRGLIDYDEGKMTQALSDYTKAIAINPKYAMAYNNRGNAYFKQGDMAAAIADFDQAIAINPDDVVYKNRALAYSYLKEHDKPLKQLQGQDK